MSRRRSSLRPWILLLVIVATNVADPLLAFVSSMGPQLGASGYTIWSRTPAARCMRRDNQSGRDHVRMLYHRRMKLRPTAPLSQTQRVRGRDCRVAPLATSHEGTHHKPTDAAGIIQRPRTFKRRKGFNIGPKVWTKFREEQKNVTEALTQLNSEDDVRRAFFSDDTRSVDVADREDQWLSPERVTLGRFMMEESSKNPELKAMVSIMKAVGKSCTAVSRLVRRAQVEGMAGLYRGDGDGLGISAVNVQGEVQKELDVLSNSIFLTGFCQPKDMSCVASEEEETPRICSAVVGDDSHGGEYAAVFDPLDGSANIEAGLPCGTIFGILRTSGSAREGRTAGPSTIVLPGRRLVAAGYCLYGPSTQLVFTLGKGVYEFTLDEAREKRGVDEGGIGGGGLDFVLSRSNIRIPKSGKVCSVNEANSPSWSEAIQDYFRDLKVDSDEDSKANNVPKENQYAGALVADLHNVLMHGGVFAYPADVRNPNGKLRLLYEGNPMAMIVEQAGGVATTGFEPIRDVRPQSVHHRIPAFLGSPDNLLPLLCPKYLHSRR